MALAEGWLSRDEVDSLREEVARLGRGPLELLTEQGRLSPDTLASLRRDPARAHGPRPDTGEPEATLPPVEEGVAPPPRSDSPAFPVPHWDRYRCVRFLGQGGMGRVFLAHDPRLRREVALKFVRDEDPELTRRFIAEARAQARVDHERVCRVYEVGEVQGRAYIAMRYVDGQPLHALASPLTVEQKALVLRDAALGVHAAHRAGLVHRDLKPSNILVERTEDSGLRPSVMDFGLARDWKDSDTASGTVLGTPHYMAPEQARGDVARLDRRADVYSLGATLYHLLTGQPPVPGSNGLEVLSRIATHEPRPPRALDADIPRDLEAIVLKCLEKDRSARYDSARALADDLDRFLNGEPVQARPSPGYRLRKRLRKHWRAAAALSVVGWALALGVGQTVRSRREVARREQLARRFTESVERIDALARASGEAPLHDTRADRRALRARMADIEAGMREAGPEAEGSGHYALGRAFLALDDVSSARQHLDAAWATGEHEPRVAYALAWVLGAQYQRARLEAERSAEPSQREAKQRDAEQRLRAPALDFLQRSQGAEVPAPEYVEALRAFHEDRPDAALQHLDALGGRLTWLHEAPLLRGDILHARALHRWNAGQREAAREDFEAGRRAYAEAAAIGRSVPAVHRARADLEQDALLMEVSGGGDVLPSYTQGLEAVGHALTANPDDADAHLLASRLHRRFAQQRVSQGSPEAEALLGQAVASARQALALAPTNAVAWHALGSAYWQWSRARQQRNQDPSEQLRASADAFEHVPAPERDFNFHIDRGLVYRVWADHEGAHGDDPSEHRARAIEAFRTALAQASSPAETWINLGTECVKQAADPHAPSPEASLDEASAALSRARELDPSNVVPWFYEGEALVTRARLRRDHGGDARPDLERALALYRHGATLNAHLPQLPNGVGTALFEQAKEAWSRGEDAAPLVRQSLEAYAQAQDRAPTQGFAAFNAGEVRAWWAAMQLANGDSPVASARDAETSLQQALRALPDLPEAWTQLGRARLLVGAFEQSRGQDAHASLTSATEALQKAVGLNPSLALAWRYLGETQALSGHGEDALRSVEKAVALEPTGLEHQLASGHVSLIAARASRDAAPVLKRGLARVEQALSTRLHWPEAQALRAALLSALAETPAPPDTRSEWLRRAREDLDAALQGNRHLERAWGSLDPRARQEATAPPP
ncbi:serine/threonine protein kinase [Corallococcus sp. H22C18031201]|nr:serine/threonine protein kinase [Corallococcus sp. H22C18031201]